MYLKNQLLLGSWRPKHDHKPETDPGFQTITTHPTKLPNKNIQEFQKPKAPTRQHPTLNDQIHRLPRQLEPCLRGCWFVATLDSPERADPKNVWQELHKSKQYIYIKVKHICIYLHCFWRVQRINREWVLPLPIDFPFVLSCPGPAVLLLVLCTWFSDAGSEPCRSFVGHRPCHFLLFFLSFHLASQPVTSHLA